MTETTLRLLKKYTKLKIEVAATTTTTEVAARTGKTTRNMGILNGTTLNDNNLNTYKAHPFLKVLRPKQSEFNITVPTVFCFDAEKGNAQNRQLWFSDFRIVPNFFSEKANALKMDSDVELSVVEDRFQLETLWTNLFLPKEKTDTADTRETITLKTRPPENTYDARHALIALNQIGVRKKLPSQKFPPFFCDWIYLQNGDTFEQSGSKVLSQGGVNEKKRQNVFELKLSDSSTGLVEQLYGDQDYDATKHKVSMLDPAIQAFPGINNFAWPMDNVDVGVRVRLFIQPGCTLTMSNFNILKLLGFAETQTAGVKKQIHIHNSKSNEWKVITAFHHPRGSLEHKDDGANRPTKVSVLYRYENQITPSKEIFLSLTKRQFLHNKTLIKEVKEIVEDVLALDMNVEVKYDNDTKKFIFPTLNNILARCCLHVSTTLAQQLGYGPHNMIDGTMSTRVNNIPGENDFQVQAKTLVYDTGIAYLTAKNTISNLLTNDNETFILSLEPASEGILKMTPSVTIAFHASTMFSGSHEMDLPFKIYTIQPDGQHVPLHWLTGAHIYGNLWSKV